MEKIEQQMMLKNFDNIDRKHWKEDASKDNGVRQSL